MHSQERRRDHAMIDRPRLALGTLGDSGVSLAFVNLLPAVFCSLPLLFYQSKDACLLPGMASYWLEMAGCLPHHRASLPYGS